jgi:hypothetical protein
MKLRPVTYQFNAQELDLFLAGNNAEQQKHVREIDYSAASQIKDSGFIAQEVDAAVTAGYSFVD